jgi:CubicO group peptidase (beta-lactamase class C family)
MQVVSVHRMALLCIPGSGARDITLGDLLRHTSGIADHQDLLEAEGTELTYPADRLLDSWTA